MKTVFLALLLASRLEALAEDPVVDPLDEIRQNAQTEFWRNTSKAEETYRATISTAFAFADRIEVFQLGGFLPRNFEITDENEKEVFPVRPSQRWVKIIKRREVPREEFPAWRNAITKLFKDNDTGGQAACHDPVHGIRLRRGDRIIFETSICWRCGNYTFDYSGSSEFVTINDTANDLKVLLENFMPLKTKDGKSAIGPNIEPVKK